MSFVRSFIRSYCAFLTALLALSCAVPSPLSAQTFSGDFSQVGARFNGPDNNEDVNGRIRTAYMLNGGETKRFTLNDVDTTNAVGASFNFSIFAAAGQVLQYRLNQGAWHDFELQAATGFEGTGMRAFSVPVPLGEIVQGENTLDVKMKDLVFEEMIGNIDLTIEAQP